MLRKRIWIPIAVLGLLVVLYGVHLQAASAAGDVVTLNPSTRYQTISGWEATAQAGELGCAGFDNYKDTLFDQAVNDLGINRVRLEIYSGVENPVDYFNQYINGQITLDQWKAHWFDIINDNADPNTINPNGFHFSELDYTIDHVILPLKQRVEANGEHLYINLNYVDFGSSAFEHKDHPEEYGEFVLATYQHLQSKYGWVPDSWEVILEPDTSTASWSATQIGNAIAAAGNRLKAAGFTPRFVAPSTTAMGKSITYFDAMIGIPGVSTYLHEISYHRYSDVSDSYLLDLSSRAVQYGMDTAMLERIGSDYQDLHKDLEYGRNSAWQEYTLAYCSTNDNGAQYYMIDNTDPNHPIVILSRRAKILRQYFRFIRAGAVRIGATSTDSYRFDPLAFINTNGKYVVVVKAYQSGSFAVQGLPAGNYGIKYSTNSAYNVDLPDQAVGAGQTLTTSIPDVGVITIYDKAGVGTQPSPTPYPNLTPQAYLPLLMKVPKPAVQQKPSGK